MISLKIDKIIVIMKANMESFAFVFEQMMD